MLELKPSCQYGDLYGELVCDGHMGPFLSKLAGKAKLPPDYVTIAMSIYVGEGGYNSLSLFAYDTKIYGKLDDAAIQAGGEIEVKKFDLDISANEILSEIKRLDIVAKHHCFKDIRIITKDAL